MNAALRANLKSEDDLRPVIDGMMELNRAAAEAMLECDVHACTDVTGFGLAGHLHEMLEASGCAARLDWEALPLFDGVYELSCDYCRPGKTFGIIDWASAFVEQGGIDDFEFDDRMGVLCDPQTSGGLLLAVTPDAEDAVHAAAAEFGIKLTAIGELVTARGGRPMIELR